MVTPIVSFLAQSNSQIGRLKNLNGLASDLTRQLTTQKKTDTFMGLGAEANNVQRYRMDKSLLKTFSGNVDMVGARMKLMTTTLERTSTSAREVLSAIKTKIGTEDLVTIKSIAGQAMPFLRDLANVDIDGRFLFAGSDTTSRPLDSNAPMNTLSTDLWADFKAGTITADDLLTRLNGLSSLEMGFNPSLTASGSVSVRVDTSTEIDYTSKASTNGMQDIFMATSMLSQLSALDPALDVATDEDMEKVLDGIISILQRGIDDIGATASDLGSKYDLVNSLQDMHAQDMAMLDKLIGDRENADTAEVAVKLQSLQTQLTASYQVTGMMSQLSLVNFI